MKLGLYWFSGTFRTVIFIHTIYIWNFHITYICMCIYVLVHIKNSFYGYSGRCSNPNIWVKRCMVNLNRLKEPTIRGFTYEREIPHGPMNVRKKSIERIYPLPANPSSFISSVRVSNHPLSANYDEEEAVSSSINKD